MILVHPVWCVGGDGDADGDSGHSCNGGCGVMCREWCWFLVGWMVSVYFVSILLVGGFGGGGGGWVFIGEFFSIR